MAQRRRDGGEVTVDGIEFSSRDEWDGTRYVRVTAINGRRVDVAISARSARALAAALRREAKWAEHGL